MNDQLTVSFIYENNKNKTCDIVRDQYEWNKK